MSTRNWNRLLGSWGRSYLLRTAEQQNRSSLYLTGMAQWVTHLDQKVMGSSPHQGTYPSCVFNPQLGGNEKATDWCFSLTLIYFFLSLSLLSLLSKRNKKKCSQVRIIFFFKEGAYISDNFEYKCHHTGLELYVKGQWHGILYRILLIWVAAIKIF